jgi:predicted nucleic acid-binding protein
MARVRGATPIDAIVAAFAAQRTGIVYTTDVGDFQSLAGFFRGLRVFGI